MPTDLRNDLDFLERLLAQAITLHRPRSIEEATMLADIRDYFLWLTLDGFEDLSLGVCLIDRFSALQSWLQREHINQVLKFVHPDKVTFYTAFLFTLEQMLSLHHAVAKMPAEKISRADFTTSWRRTAEKLGLV